jgi:transposase
MSPEERGIAVAQGRRKLEVFLETLMAEEQGPLSPQAWLSLEDLRTEQRGLNRRISAFDEEFAEQARTDETARLPTTIPSVGALSCRGSASGATCICARC